MLRASSWLLSSSVIFLTTICATTSAQTVSVDNLQLAPANDPVNVLTLTLDAGPLGSDTDMATLTGTADATVDVSWNGTNYDITGFSISGGSVDVSDVSFSLFFGAVTADSSGLGGTPSTIAPPSVVTGGTFAGSDHQFVVNRGVIDAGGMTIDFGATPTTAPGTGMGQIDISPTPVSATTFTETYSVQSAIPIAFVEPFVIPAVPLFGDVDASFAGSGTLVTEGTITINFAGDFDRDGTLTCDDIDALGDAIRAGSADPTFDLNSDGTLNVDDYNFWVTDLQGTVIGDANFDGNTDASDFNVWNSNRFTNGTGWCSGDFNADGFTDISDFNIWNSNKFTSASAPATVPEPSGLLLLATAGLMVLRFRR